MARRPVSARVMCDMHICNGTINAERNIQVVVQHMLPLRHFCLFPLENKDTFCCLQQIGFRVKERTYQADLPVFLACALLRTSWNTKYNHGMKRQDSNFKTSTISCPQNIWEKQQKIEMTLTTGSPLIFMTCIEASNSDWQHVNAIIQITKKVYQVGQHVSSIHPSIQMSFYCI